MSLKELRAALELTTQERNDQLFPLTEITGAAVPDIPALPDLAGYINEVQRADTVESTLLPVLTAAAETRTRPPRPSGRLSRLLDPNGTDPGKNRRHP